MTWWLDAEGGRERVRSQNDAANWPDDPAPEEEPLPDDVCPECLGRGEHREDCPNTPQPPEEQSA